MNAMQKINYTEKGGYLYPDVTLSEKEEEKSLGKYGLMRSKHLKEHQPLIWGELLMTGKLMEHLCQVDNMAREQVEQMVEQMAKKTDLPSRKHQPVEWAQHMAMLKAQAEETVVRELICDD